LSISRYAVCDGIRLRSIAGNHSFRHTSRYGAAAAASVKQRLAIRRVVRWALGERASGIAFD